MVIASLLGCFELICFCCSYLIPVTADSPLGTLRAKQCQSGEQGTWQLALFIDADLSARFQAAAEGLREHDAAGIQHPGPLVEDHGASPRAPPIVMLYQS